MYLCLHGNVLAVLSRRVKSGVFWFGHIDLLQPISPHAVGRERESEREERERADSNTEEDGKEEGGGEGRWEGGREGLREEERETGPPEL